MPIHSPGKCNLPSGTGTNLLGEPGPETRGPRTPGTEKAELDTATGVLAPPLPGPETDNIQFFLFFLKIDFQPSRAFIFPLFTNTDIIYSTDRQVVTSWSRSRAKMERLHNTDWHHRFYFKSRNQRRPKGSAPTLDKNAQLRAAPLCPARRVKLVHSR